MRNFHLKNLKNSDSKLLAEHETNAKKLKEEVKIFSFFFSLDPSYFQTS
jgi:hypothetical protein